MSDFTPSRIGQNNNSGSTDALFLKVFPGEVLAAFREENLFMPRTIVRTIASG